mmetsp:Transcript_3086/g.7281  ORF Transcript_3086/g.7281 Transcript_3086/m.7281 type:complete len:228 (+) Transcript_3086:251-934(+)|eukprot:CAMPEP_0116089118 /NCGR_PEP_ID=MMETSP0327-20121206/6258_1 /TAXON_ID=44447 /ORGANISM="Pseudo-nitzschia delicatissima, Strain B596" /LENGTH=227 /DNA_ID=CAMNT_0003580295 /DNA_START=187 /DNA_END=870 /DNA_ORIENTATION=-
MIHQRFFRGYLTAATKNWNSRRTRCRFGVTATTTTTTDSGASQRFFSGESSSSISTPWSELGSKERPSWSEEWKRLGLGADLVDSPAFPSNLFFVQLGFGVDQHGNSGATKAAIRAVRNAIEFNSIPGVIDHIPGGRKEMLIHVKLGIPAGQDINALEVAKVFPYGRLLPIEIATGGLEFHSGRLVEELGDEDDVGICCVACVSIGYNDDENETSGGHKTYSTKDGY